MSRIYNKFDFIGELVLPKDRDKFHNVKPPNDNGWETHRLNFGIKETDLNSAFVELFGGYNKTNSKTMKVYSFSKGLFGEKGQQLEIPWEDRNNPETKDMVADFVKTIVDLETDMEVKKEYMTLYYKIRNLENKEDITKEDKDKLAEYKKEFNKQAINRHEFIYEYDAILFLAEQLPKYKDKKFRVTGDVEWNQWQGKYYRKFIPKIIEIVPDETKSQLRADINIFFNRDAIDDTLFKDEKKVIINGYVQSYVREEKGDRFFPQQFIINGSNLDFTNEDHKNRFKFIVDSFKVRGKEYYNLQYLTAIYRGAELLDFTYDDLTQKQKEAVDLGLSKIEDFAPRGGNFIGGNMDEIRILKPKLMGDFADGAISTGYTDADFIELIVKDTSDVTLEDIKKEDKTKETEKNNATSEETVDIDDVLDDLLS